jgi:hypothetical protein
MRELWEQRALALLWPTRLVLLGLVALVGYDFYFDGHAFLVAPGSLSGVNLVSAATLLLGLVAAGWLGFTHAALYRLNPPDPDRARPAGIFGMLKDRLTTNGEAVLSFIGLAAIIWFGYGHSLPKLMHAMAAHTPSSVTMTMNGDYKFDGSPVCATATGFVEIYGFETICLPESLRDRVDGHYGVELVLNGETSRYGFGVKGVNLR